MQCPTHKKQLDKLAELDPTKKCEICGGREAKLYCKSCRFLLCGDCRICDNRHFLVRMIELCVRHVPTVESEGGVLRQQLLL